jgi:hypothetical protein
MREQGGGRSVRGIRPELDHSMSSLKEKQGAPLKPMASLEPKSAENAAVWAEARLVYPLYYFLATHFKLETPLTRQADLPVSCPTAEVFECVVRWLDIMDTSIRANQLRQLLQSVKDIKPENLRAVILRLLRRPVKSATDRDNIDLLLATYFALCAPEDLYACEITLGDVAQVLSDIFPDADATELEWCAPLNQILEATKQCRGLRDIFAGKLLEKGRELKDAAGFMFYDPAALIAFTRFNFLLRRAFFRLLHADLRAIREGLTELERRGISTVDCRSAGLTAQEPIEHLRDISLSWRQPIRSDYAEESANRTFEQLLSIRTAVERALGIVTSELKMPQISGSLSEATETQAPGKTGSAKTTKAAVEVGKVVTQQPTAKAPAVTASAIPPVKNSSAPRAAEPAKLKNEAAMPPLKQPAAPAPIAASAGASGETSAATKEKQPAPVSPAKAGNAPSPELEQCLEDIWEQLIDAPPTRGRSMSTVSLGGARVLLSAWEVNAFVSDGGQVSDDLRRAVAARGLVAVAREELKNSGKKEKLDAAIAQGRQEMTYLQERVEQAQRAKNTEAAVNLGISARRLLSAIEEAQQS